jgi:hypothetical protein
MRLINNIRLIVLLVLLLLSAYLFFSPFIFKRTGVTVAFIEENSKCGEIKEEDIITQIGGHSIKNKEDFEDALQEIKEDEHVTMVVNGGPGGCTALADKDLGLKIGEIPSDRLRLGLDLQGGKIFLFESENSTEISQTIKKRIEVLNLPETGVSTSNNIVKVTSLISEKIGLLTIPGEFETLILQEIETENDKGKIILGNNSYSIELVDEKVKVNDSIYEINQSFLLEDVELEVINVTNDSIVVYTKIFTNEDVLDVLTQLSSMTDLEQVYQFSLPVEISEQGSKNFEKVLEGLEITIVRGQQVLEGSLVSRLDGKIIGQLNIPPEMRGEIKTLAIVGYGEDKEEALDQKLRVQMVLESNKISGLELVGKETYEPKLRENALSVVLIGMIGIMVIGVSLTYIRYKKMKMGFYLILLVLSEMFCIVGAAALTQRVFEYGWIFDFESVLGLIVFGFISIVQMFLISEYRIKNKELNLWFGYRKILSLKNFFVIIVFALSFFLLFTVWKGFGLSVIGGLILGILISKPIYDQIIKQKIL